MNYTNMTTAGLQPSTASISLPPISSIDLRTHMAHHNPQEVVQALPPPPPRQLPPLPYYHSGARMPQQHEYLPQQRQIYPGMQVPSPYPLVSSRVPLPSHATDPSLMVAPARHKTKEVKRRTKTGCLTCRKRRIKCDEGRPECRNCMKSKRNCLGYDPVFQPQGPHSIHPAPAAHQNSTHASPSTSTPNQPRRFDTGSPSLNLSTSLPVTTAQSDYSFSKPSDVLPHLNQPYKMENSAQTGLPNYTNPGRPRRTIEEICTIPGTKLPAVPAIPPNQVPNLESIRKVYDIAFASGLDKFLESSQHWYASAGFDLLADNRSLLGLVLAYLTLVSNNHDGPINHNATLVSQEARVTWGLLGLCARQDQHGSDEHETLARRYRIIESLLTGEPLSNKPASMSEFVHQEPEPEPEAKEPETKQRTFDKQVSRRAEEYWACLESIATVQEMSDEHTRTTNDNANNNNNNEEIMELLAKLKTLLDGRENRDIVYSILLLRWSGNGGDPSSERELARRFLEMQSQGRATDLVAATVSGMGVRAFA